MNVSDPNYEILGDENIINVSDVKERIRRLKPWHVEDQEAGRDLGSFASERGAIGFIGERSHLVAVVYSDEIDELTALQALLNELGDISDDSYLVHDDYLEEYAEGDSELPADSPLSPYVDWGRVADDNYRGNYASVEFRGQTYWVVTR